MPPAARKTDPTGHGPPLSPGPGSFDVDIGGMPAWRALPASVGAAAETLSNDIKGLLDKSTLNPASAAADVAKIAAGITQSAAKAALEGNPAAPATAASQLATLTSTVASLSGAWTAAVAVPGGQPAADQAFTLGMKAVAGVVASATFAAIAGTSDIHNCSIPVPPMPHGPGLVTKGSSTVMINGLPAVRQGDNVMEACGGGDPISTGYTTVDIG